ncbi:MAG: exodeoxyribonuclease VII large subunit [Clostridiales bacterium]|jgi:exodeoxyribonuclease VII large subunit|nr:exodeoxyribonuclease VII large subunit [Clostridiales bacterium]
MKPKTWNVSQLNAYLKGLVDGDALLRSFAVEGELSNVRRHGSGHIYFTLKDARSAISGVMFRGYAASLAFEPAEGAKAVVVGFCSLFERTGQLQLYAEGMFPAGRGEQLDSLERLKNRLASEGVFDAARKRPLPVSPSRIAVITSETGAVARDIVSVARRRDPSVGITVVPAAVQGGSAARSVAEALALVNANALADVVIIARGGGSAEDLSPFNDEALTRAVAASAIPVVSAVGHETDVTLTDFAADTRAPTPSAAAEIVVPDKSAKAERADALRRRLDGAVSSRLTLLSLRLRAASEALVRLSPAGALARGYALALDMNGGVKADISAFVPGETFRLRLRDGYVTANVTRTEVSADE